MAPEPSYIDRLAHGVFAACARTVSASSAGPGGRASAAVRARPAGRLRRPTRRCRPRQARRVSRPGRLGYARRNPRRGNRTPRRTLSADLHAPPRSPGRRFQPAEPPYSGRVTSRRGQQHPIRDDRVVRGPDGGRQVLRVVGVDQHPRARAPGRAVRSPRHVPDLPARESPLQLAPTLTVPHALSPPQQTRRASARRRVPAAAHHLAVASGQRARTTCPLALPRYQASGRPGQMPVSILAGVVPDRASARRLGYHPARAALSILRHEHTALGR